MHSILSRVYRPESSIGTDGSRNEPAASPTYLRKPPSSQNAAGDIILIGLAERGAYRVDCHHAFITLLENNEPYMIAEAIVPHIIKENENGKSSLVGLKTLGLKANGSYPTNDRK